jgi:Fe2+ or Zn2+ uptake regulation protein
LSINFVDKGTIRVRAHGNVWTENATTPDSTVLSVFDTATVPVLTATEVAEELDCSRGSAYNKLEALAEQGELHKKKVGARAVVYIRLNAVEHTS